MSSSVVRDVGERVGLDLLLEDVDVLAVLAHLLDRVDHEAGGAGGGQLARGTTGHGDDHPDRAQGGDGLRRATRVVGGAAAHPERRPGQPDGQGDREHHRAEDQQDGCNAAVGVADDLVALRQVRPVAEHAEGAVQVEVEAEPERPQHAEHGSREPER